MRNAWKSSAAAPAPPASLALITAIVFALMAAPNSVATRRLENQPLLWLFMQRAKQLIGHMRIQRLWLSLIERHFMLNPVVRWVTVGYLQTDSAKIEISDCRKSGDHHLHIGRVLSGQVKTGQQLLQWLIALCAGPQH